MTRRCSLSGFWLIVVLLVTACGPVRVASDILPASSLTLSTAPAPLPAKLNASAVAPAQLPAKLTPQPTITGIPVAINQFFNVSYAKISGVDPDLLSLDIYSPSKITTHLPVMIYVHGGGWSNGDKKEVNFKPEFFIKARFVFVSVNYRLNPKSKFPAQANDVAAAVAWVYKNIAKYGGDPEKISLMGHSAGGHLAVLISSNEKYLQAQGLGLKNIRAVIALDTAGYDLSVFAKRSKGSKLPDPYGATFGQNPADWKSASPVTYIEAGKDIPPMVVVYSGDAGIGSVVSRKLMSEEFSQTLARAGVKHELTGALEKNHNEINTDFGRPGDSLSEQVLISLKKIAPAEFN